MTTTELKTRAKFYIESIDDENLLKSIIEQLKKYDDDRCEKGSEQLRIQFLKELDYRREKSRIMLENERNIVKILEEEISYFDTIKERFNLNCLLKVSPVWCEEINAKKDIKQHYRERYKAIDEQENLCRETIKKLKDKYIGYYKKSWNTELFAS